MSMLSGTGRSKAGLPPGTIVHIGKETGDAAVVTAIRYNATGSEVQRLGRLKQTPVFPDDGRVTWLNIDGISDVQTLERIGELFGIHRLCLEDIAHTNQRPKVEDFGDFIYIVARMLTTAETDDGDQLASEQISIILKGNIVLTFQETEGDIFDTVRERIRAGKGRVREMGADYLVYVLLDTIVDHYFTVLESIGEHLELLEDEVVESPGVATLEKIHSEKRDMIYLRRSVWPLREVIQSMQRMEDRMNREVQLYLRDLYDHSVRVVETIETYRDLLAGLLDVYLSSINNRMNAVMKALTVIATIFLPLTFITGIYGMNFLYMPPRDTHWGFFASLGVMVLVAVSLLSYFRYKRWL